MHIIDISIELLVLFNVDEGVGLIKSDKLDEDDCIALMCFKWEFVVDDDVLFSSFKFARSNMGTEREIGEDFDGDSCWTGSEAKDLFIEIFRLSDTGERIDLSLWWIVIGGWNTFELIIVVVPQRWDADGVGGKVEHGWNDVDVKQERRRDLFNRGEQVAEDEFTHFVILWFTVGD